MAKYELSATIKIEIPLFFEADSEEELTPAVEKYLEPLLNQLTTIDFEDYSQAFDSSRLKIDELEIIAVDGVPRAEKFTPEQEEIAKQSRESETFIKLPLSSSEES